MPNEIMSVHTNIKFQEDNKDEVTMLARCTFDSEAEEVGVVEKKMYYKGDFVLNDPENESVLFDGEKIWSANEYAPGRILACGHSKIFNLKDWKML